MNTYNEVDIAFISNVGIPSATATRKSDVHMGWGCLRPNFAAKSQLRPRALWGRFAPRVTMSVP